MNFNNIIFDFVLKKYTRNQDFSIFTPSNKYLNKMKTIFRVNQIRSERATLREGLEPRTIESHVGDFNTYEEAKEVYDATGTGREVDKELLKLVGTGINDEETILETTY